MGSEMCIRDSPNTLYIYLGRNWGDRNYLSNVAAHLSSFVPNTYGLQNQNLVESLNQGQSILDDYLYNRGIETGQSLDYYSQYQVQLDNDLNNILDSDSANLQTDLITLTLYVHEGSASGPVIPGALITGNDGSSNSFQQTTDNSGYVIIEGDPGTWSFSVSAAGYETNNWDQDINEDDIKDAFLQQEQDQDITLTLYIHDESASGPIIPDAQVTGWDGLSNSFEQTSSSSGYVAITGDPGIWSFSVSAAQHRVCLSASSSLLGVVSSMVSHFHDVLSSWERRLGSRSDGYDATVRFCYMGRRWCA